MAHAGVQAVRRRIGSKRLIELIGNTPLLSLPRIERGFPGVRLFAKAEWFNPGGSVKDRAATSIIADAEASGRLMPGRAILDASSGNTAVAYAMIAAAKGYHATLCVPKNANPQVLSLLRVYGAEVVLTDPLQGSDGAIREARRLATEDPAAFVYLDQYNNPANWQAHYRTTAAEIWKQTKGTVTHFVAGLGTTGTFTGTSRRLKELNPVVRTIAIQPDAPLHGLEGLKHLDSAIVPGIYDPAVPDETRFVSTEAAYAAVQRLIEEEGILVGPSGGAALAASLRLAEDLASNETAAVIVMVFPDSGVRYVAEGLFARSGVRQISS
ncbi:MAG: cysteine synthase family protein [Candidatus Omnitrophica bacterium]|nr:cysteine synthase family protein [Candidatus Omnitrophota bacterium]